MSRDLKNPKVVPHPLPTTDHQNKKKVSALKSEILIKYKRIKWTLAVRLRSLGSGWVATFWFFKSLDINMVYTSGIYVYIYKIYLCTNFFIKLKKFSTIFKITLLGGFF